MKHQRNDRVHNAASNPGPVTEDYTPRTPRITFLKLDEEPPQIALGASEAFEGILGEADSSGGGLRDTLASSSRHGLFCRNKSQLSFTLNAITKNISEILSNSYDKRELFRLKKSRTSIYAAICVNGKTSRGWSRTSFVKCR